MSSGQPFSPLFTTQFHKAVKKLDSVTKAKLQTVADEICENPFGYKGSECLSYEWSGFRSVPFDGKRRIIYRVCEECVRKHQQNHHPLACCVEGSPGEAVITFVDFGDYHYDAGRNKMKPKNYSVGQSE